MNLSMLRREFSRCSLITNLSLVGQGYVLSAASPIAELGPDQVARVSDLVVQGNDVCVRGA